MMSFKTPSYVRSMAGFVLFMLVMPTHGQHHAHTHGRAALNLVLNTDRELMVELIAPAESVYGFEHAPRNAQESAQMQAGIEKLKAAGSKLLVFKAELSCQTEVRTEAGYTGAKTTAKPDHHGHDHHDHADAHSPKDQHHDVMLRWLIRCESNLNGQEMSIHWQDVLSDIHHVEVTVLTADRQEALSLKRSGQTVRL